MKIKHTLAILALAASNAQAIEVTPFTWQCDQECFWQRAEDRPDGLSEQIVVVGYRYDWPSLVVETPPLFITPAAPVPEPSAWLLLLAGGAGVGFVVRRRKH